MLATYSTPAQQRLVCWHLAIGCVRPGKRCCRPVALEFATFEDTWRAAELPLPPAASAYRAAPGRVALGQWRLLEW